MKNESNTGQTKDQTQAQKLSAEIKKGWGKLTDEEIGFQTSNPSKFFDAVKTKYSINRDEAEKTVKKMDAECAASCGMDEKAANDSNHGSKPAVKAS